MQTLTYNVLFGEMGRIFPGGEKTKRHVFLIAFDARRLPSSVHAMMITVSEQDFEVFCRAQCRSVEKPDGGQQTRILLILLR